MFLFKIQLCWPLLDHVFVCSYECELVTFNEFFSYFVECTVPYPERKTTLIYPRVSIIFHMRFILPLGKMAKILQVFDSLLYA